MKLRRAILGVVAACPLAVFSAQAAASGVTFTSTADEQMFVVPAGVTSLSVDAIGGSGGCAVGAQAGLGAEVVGAVPVTPGQTLYVEVGGDGTTSSGGFNGGGAPGGATTAGGGGGATDVRTTPAAGSGSLASRLVVAGGGGGGGGNNAICGGDADSTRGSSASATSGGPGTVAGPGMHGVTSACPPAGDGHDGVQATGGAGGSAAACADKGGGGGGGLFGGGGGAAGTVGAGGGGGSSGAPGASAATVAVSPVGSEPKVTLSYNLAPHAALTPSATTVYTGDPVTFDAAGSSDPDGDALSYGFDLGNHTYEIPPNSGTTAYQTSFDSPGTKTVGVRVSDGNGHSDIATASVEVVTKPAGGGGGGGGAGGGGSTTPPSGGGGQSTGGGSSGSNSTPTVSVPSTTNTSVEDVRENGLPVTVSCAQACSVSGDLLLDSATAKHLGFASRLVVVGTAKATLRHAGKVVLRIRFKRRAIKRQAFTGQVAAQRKIKLILRVKTKYKKSGKSSSVRRKLVLHG